MRRLLRFFLFGPGAVLLVVGMVIGIAYLIKEGQDKQRAEAEKHQVRRPLGQVKPSETIDDSTAPKEVVLSNQRLNPAAGSGQDIRAIPQPTPAFASTQRAALPQLVSFYASPALFWIASTVYHWFPGLSAIKAPQMPMLISAAAVGGTFFVVGIPFAGLLATWFSSAQIATLERQTIKLQRNRARIQKERRDRDSYDVR